MGVSFSGDPKVVMFLLVSHKKATPEWVYTNIYIYNVCFGSKHSAVQWRPQLQFNLPEFGPSPGAEFHVCTAVQPQSVLVVSVRRSACWFSRGGVLQHVPATLKPADLFFGEMAVFSPNKSGLHIRSPHQTKKWLS